MDISKYSIAFGEFKTNDQKGSKGKTEVILTDKKTKQSYIIGTHYKDVETYSTNGSRMDNKKRTVHSFVWHSGVINLLVGRIVKISNLKRSINHEEAELKGCSGNYTRPTLKIIKEDLKNL